MNIKLRRNQYFRFLAAVVALASLVTGIFACNQLSTTGTTNSPTTVQPWIITVEIPVEVTRVITKKQVVTREVPIIQTVQVEVTRLVSDLPQISTPPPSAQSTANELLLSNRRMNVPRTLHTATTLSDGSVFIVGGYTAIDVDTAHVEIFNPADQKFVLSVPLNLARHGHSATLLPDGRVLVIAGYAGTWLASGEIFDPGLGKWTDTQPVYPHGTIHTATLLNDGRVLVIAGGTRSGSPGPDDRVEIFDPRTNSWQRAAPHQGTQGGHTATLLADGRVLIAGGNADPSIYDPNLDTWQPAGKLVTNRSQPQAVLLRDGKVLLVGGTSPYRELVLENVEIYNPISNTWQQAAPMAQPRYLHTTTLLPDGRVLVTGGGRLLDNSFDDPNAILDTIEIYDPARDSWNIYHPLQQARANHTANLLPNGQVVVTGGWATGYAILNSIEILSIPPR